MKSVLSHTISGAICIIILLATHGVHADSQSKRIDQYLQSVLKVTPDTEFIDVYLLVKYHLSYDQLRSSTSGLSRKERQRAVVSILKNHAANTQSDVLAHLQRARAQGMVNNIQVIWAINVIAFMAMPSVIYDLARNFDKIEKIFFDPQYPEDLLIDDEGITKYNRVNGLYQYPNSTTPPQPGLILNHHPINPATNLFIG